MGYSVIMQTIFKTKPFRVTFNGVQEGGTYSTLFDLSNNKLVVPKDVYNDIAYYFGGKASYIYCSDFTSVPDLQLNIYGKTYALPIKQYLVPEESNPTYCDLQITYANEDDEDQFVIGRHFLKKYCLFLDYDESVIGLAEAN
jgi:hypothetical protein